MFHFTTRTVRASTPESQRGRRRAILRVEELESRNMLSVSVTPFAPENVSPSFIRPFRK